MYTRLPSLSTGLGASLLAGLLVLGGCAGAPRQHGSDAATAAPGEGVDVPARLTLDEANDVTLYALSLVGTPYRYGGNTPESGFDCSGLIGHVYKSRANIAAPRTVAALVRWGQPIPANSLRTGDLVVFLTGSSSAATHAGIYVGEGRFVHAPSTGGDVRLDPLTAKYWARQQVVFRRP